MPSVVTLMDLTFAHVKLDILEMAKVAPVSCFILEIVKSTLWTENQEACCYAQAAMAKTMISRSML